MSKRLQVLFDEEEWDEIRQVARRHGLTVSDWVRGALRAARRAEPTGDEESKLALLRAASRHAFPTGDIEQVLSEIEQGYLSGS